MAFVVPHPGRYTFGAYQILTATAGAYWKSRRLGSENELSGSGAKFELTLNGALPLKPVPGLLSTASSWYGPMTP